MLQEPDIEETEDQYEPPVEKPDGERAAALFVLRSMEVHKISQVHVSCISNSARVKFLIFKIYRQLWMV